MTEHSFYYIADLCLVSDNYMSTPQKMVIIRRQYRYLTEVVKSGRYLCGVEK